VTTTGVRGMDGIVAAVFVFVYFGMILGRIPGLALDRTGIAPGGLAPASGRRSRSSPWRLPPDTITQFGIDGDCRHFFGQSPMAVWLLTFLGLIGSKEIVASVAMNGCNNLNGTS